MNSAGEPVEAALSRAAGQLSEYQSKRLLAEYGIPVVDEILAEKREDVLQAAVDLGWPVVLKYCSSQLTHKTEQGLIALNLNNPEELKEAFERLSSLAAETGLEGAFLVQRFIRGDRELVAGLIRDPLFGPCIMFGLGGIMTEALGDVTFRVAPFSRAQAEQLLQELRSAKILGEFRGQPAVDREILIETLMGLGRIGLDHPEIKELDINPLVIREGRPVAVDALVILDREVPKEADRGVRTEGLGALFEPRSVAVIGATAKEGKAGNDVIKNILANGYRGDLHLVNPKGGRIMGRRVAASIEDLPDGIDQAIIILPAQANPDAIRACAAKGIKAVVLAAGGFAEVDENGSSLQEELARAVTETGIRALGPNTSGHTSTPHNFTSSFFPLGRLPKGPISYIAQTGNFATHTMRSIMSTEYYGVARVIGLGNKIDFDETDALAYLAQDRETKAIFCYLESLARPRLFLETAAEVTKKKPVVMLKGGSSEDGARAAVAHTAALASDRRIMDAALRQVGIVQIHEYSHLILAAKALVRMPPPRGNRVAFLAPSGAMLVALTDLCRLKLGLTVPRVEERTRARLQEISPSYIRMRNPVDIWPAAAVSGVEFAYREGMKAVLEDPNIDAVVPVLMMTDETGVPDLTFILDLADTHPDKPIYITFSGEKKHMDAARDFLEPHGVPTYPLIEQPFEVLSILARCRGAMER